ncbi:MAG: glycosyltransferase family 2 protein [Solirubrobacterales bacterium]
MDPDATPSEVDLAPRATTLAPGPIAIVAARNEADRLGDTLATLAEALGAELYVADDASTDATPDIARAFGARVVRGDHSRGKGANVGFACEVVLAEVSEAEERVVLLCDGDLGESAAALAPLVEAIETGECDLAIAAFALKVGGGFGIAVSFSRWATRRLSGIELTAPISGQRALRGSSLRTVLPFASGYGMETAMNIDAARAGLRLAELELELEHRATGRTLAGFLHRGRQLVDFLRVYRSRLRG